MTKAGWLIAGAGAALAGVVAFFWIAGGSPGEEARAPRVAPRAGAAGANARPEVDLAAAAAPDEPEAEGAEAVGPATELERTAVGGESTSAGFFEFRVIEQGTEEPVSDAEVTYFWKEADADVEVPWDYEELADFDAIARRVRSDAAGYVRLKIQGDRLYATAKKKNYWGRADFEVEDLDEEDPGEEDPWEEVESRAHQLEVAPDWSLTVQVLDHADQPASGVPVVLRRRIARRSRARLNWKGESGADGTYRFEHVGYRMATTEGEWEWTVELDLLLLEDLRQVLDPEELLGETVVLRMPAVGALEVTVFEPDGSRTEDGTVVQAGIVAEGQPRDISPFSSHERDYVRAETAGGSATYPFVELGQEYELKVSHAGDRVETREYRRGPDVAGEEREVEVTLGLENPVLVFRAVSEAGAPLAEEELGLEMSFRSNFMSNSWNREATTDAEGLFRVDVDSTYEEGDLRFLTVSHGEDADARVAHVDLGREFTPGQHDMGDVVLGASPILVAGRVTDAGGAPIEGAEISVQAKHTRADENVWWDQLDAGAETGAAGTFELRGVTPATELFVTASRDGRRGDSVVAQKGEAGVQLLLFDTGGLKGSALLDEGIPHEKIVVKVERGGATPLPDGMYGGRDDQVYLDEDGSFAIDSLIPGIYTLDVNIEHGHDPLLTIEGIMVAAGSPTRDPRLQAIDLRGRLFMHTLVLVTPEPTQNIQGSLQLREADDEDGQQQWQWFNESPVEIVCEHEAIDVELGVRGFRGQMLEDVRGEREVVLDNGLPIRLILRTDGDIPEPPYYVKAVLVPQDDSGYINIDWGAPAFDETREVQTRAYGTGRMKVQWLVEKRGSSGGALATTANVEPEQFVEVVDTPVEQVFEVEITAEQLVEITRDL